MKNIKQLKEDFEYACRKRDGIAMGNAAQILRCTIGMNYWDLAKLALQNGLDVADYDELISHWDEEDLLDRKSY